MLSSKSVSANKHDPTGPVRTIVSKSVVNLRNIPIKQKLSVINSQRIVFGRSLLPLIIALLSVALRMTEELQDWLEAEAEADSGSQSGRL